MQCKRECDPYPAPRRRGDPAGVRRGQPPDCGDTPGGAQRDRQPDAVRLRCGRQSDRDHGQPGAQDPHCLRPAQPGDPAHRAGWRRAAHDL